MRVAFMFFAVLFGATVLAATADAQRPHAMQYIYPDGTIAYQVGPYNYRSNYYMMPTVTEGFRNWTNVTPYQYQQFLPQYNVQPYYDNRGYNNYWRWDGYRYYGIRR